MNPKSVAFIVSYFPTVSQTFIVNQINGLIDSGYLVNLYSYKKASANFIHDSIKRNNLHSKVNYFLAPPSSKFSRVVTLLKFIIRHFFIIKWHLLFKCINVSKYGKDAYTLKLVFEAQWFLLPFDFKIIHAHFGMNGNRIAYLKTHGIIKDDVKLLTTFHGYDLVPSSLNDYKIKYKHLLKQSDAFTVNTPYLHKILSPLNIFEKPTYILPVGPEIPLFTRTSQKANMQSFDIAFCGKLIPLKGPDIAIEIINELHLNGFINVRLHIVGEGQMSNQLIDQVIKYGLKDYVVFYGSQPQLCFKNLLEGMDLFILSGRYDPETKRAETQGLVLQEAQAMEIPVVVNDVGGMSYGLIPNETGFVIKEGNIEGFVDAIKTLILDSELRQRMGKKGREFVEKNYSNSVLTKRLLEIYKSL